MTPDQVESSHQFCLFDAEVESSSDTDATETEKICGGSFTSMLSAYHLGGQSWLQGNDGITLDVRQQTSNRNSTVADSEESERDLPNGTCLAHTEDDPASKEILLNEASQLQLTWYWSCHSTPGIFMGSSR